MKTFCLLAAACALAFLPATSRANLLITELNSNASGGDFWELTNFGNTAVDLFTGSQAWSWDDDSDLAGTILVPVGTTIAPGESILFLHGITSTDTSAFRAAWNLDAAVRIVAVINDVGLGGSDRVTLFDASGTAVVSFNYAANGFTRADGTASAGGHAGLSAGGVAVQSAIWVPTSGTTPGTARYTFADGTNFGSYDAPGSTGFGSPGVVPEPSTAALLVLAGLGAWLVIFRRRSTRA